MIKKFIKIQNVGRFSDFASWGDKSLDKVDIVYGENSAGKTTLTSIIRSLSRNEPDLILERRTHGAQESPYVEVLCEGNRKYTFQDDKWNNSLEGIEIFDVFFVDENVYTGLQISSEHQKGLHQFALGEEGVRLAREIEKLKLVSEGQHEKLRQLQERIAGITGTCFTPEDFVQLQEGPKITEEIKRKKQDIKTAEAGQQIKEKQVLSEIPSLKLTIDLEALKKLLQKSLEEISEESLERVKEHIGRLAGVLEKEAETWLQQGLSYVQIAQNGKCPFCQRDLKEVESLIIAYNQYFNEEYKRLKKNVSSYLEEVNTFSVEEALNQKRNIILQNNTLVEFWKNYLEPLEVPKADLDGVFKDIKDAFGGIKQLVEDKSKSILEPVNTDIIDNSVALQQKFSSQIDSYNSQARSWNSKIEALRKKQLDLNELKEMLKKLEIKQKRFLPENIKICDKHKRVSQSIQENQKLVEEEQKQQKEAVSQKITKYAKRINDHLEKFGVSFRVKGAKSTYRGRSKEPYLEYGIEMETKEIDLANQVKHSLGEGDKNALAFAFFLAKLNPDEQIDNKIIVFDDPVSSLDRNRRKRTVEYIRDLTDKVKQVIVLTHYDYFASELYSALKDIGVKPRTLQIHNGKIDGWDIEEAMKHPYFIGLIKLERFLGGKEEISPKEAKELIRLVLEAALKFRYFKYFDGLGKDIGLGSMVRKLSEAVENEKDFRFRHDDKEEVIRELGNLNDFSSPSHHGNIEHLYKEKDLSAEEIKGYVRSTLIVIYEWL